VLVARAHLAKAETQAALDDLDHVKPDAIEPIAIRLAHRMAHGEATALLGDTDGGYAEIEAARAEADKAGYVELALLARLAKLGAAIALGAPDAADQQKALAADARKHGFVRIAQEAETAAQR